MFITSNFIIASYIYFISLFILIKLSIRIPLHYSYTNKFKSTIFHHFFRIFFLQTTTKRQTVYVHVLHISLSRRTQSVKYPH